jgi:hypothetical protein
LQSLRVVKPKDLNRSQNQLRLPMSKRDEPYLEITLELFSPIFLYTWTHSWHACLMKFWNYEYAIVEYLWNDISFPDFLRNK